MRDSADAYGSIGSSKPTLQQFVLQEHTILSLFLQLGQGKHTSPHDSTDIDNGNSRQYRGSEDSSELGTQSKRIAVAAISLVLPLWLIVVSSPNEDGWFWRATVIALLTSGAVYAARRMITMHLKPVCNGCHERHMQFLCDRSDFCTDATSGCKRMTCCVASLHLKHTVVSS
eukprot:8284-Heterococcus_DN1.PRE.1